MYISASYESSFVWLSVNSLRASSFRAAPSRAVSMYTFWISILLESLSAYFSVNVFSAVSSGVFVAASA